MRLMKRNQTAIYYCLYKEKNLFLMKMGMRQVNTGFCMKDL